MKTDQDECFAAALAALNTTLQLRDVAEVSANGSFAEALRVHIKGGDTDGYVKRPVSTLRAQLARENREKTMRSRFFDFGVLATTSANKHIYLVGFDDDGFAHVESFYWDARIESFVFSGYPLKLPVQSSLSPCIVYTEVAHSKPGVSRDEINEMLFEIVEKRAEDHRARTKLRK